MARKIDYLGSFLLAATLAVMIVAFSWAGSTYPWFSIQIIGLLASLRLCGSFLIRVERKAEEPILAPEVMTNRTFLTAAFAGLLSYFGMLTVTMYYPLFLQGVQGTSASLSGKVITPFGIIMAFMGVPTGFLIAKTKRYKWMLIAGYTIITCTTFAMVTFNAGTPIWLGSAGYGNSGIWIGSNSRRSILSSRSLQSQEPTGNGGRSDICLRVHGQCDRPRNPRLGDEPELCE